MDVREMRQRRGAATDEAGEILAAMRSAGRNSLTPSEQQKFDALMAEDAELRQTIERIERHAGVAAELAKPMPRKTETTIRMGAEYAESDRDLALRAWALGPSRATRPMLEAAERCGVRSEAREFVYETRALSVGTTDSGGYSVPDTPMQRFWEVLKAYGGVRPVATVLRTQTGSVLPIPTVSDVANVGEIVAEAGAVTTTVDPIFGVTNLDSYKYSSKAVIVSVELLQDSFINLGDYLAKALATRIARIQNTHFTTGDGSAKPLGVATAASLGKTCAATNAITYSEVVDLMHSVDPSRRANSKFMMSDTVVSYVRKLADSTGRFLWEQSYQAGQPDRLFGHEVVVNNDMSTSFTTNNRLILFGDFSAYHIRDAGPVTFIRADEIRVLNHQVVFLAYMRTDGDLVGTESVRYLRTA